MIGAWGGMMLALQLMPPMWQDPDGRWRRIWNQRLTEAEPFMLPWHQHQTRDEYWTKRVLAIEKIQAPTFLIGGMRELFPDAMTRAYERIQAPKKLWLGPWQHAMPDTAAFEPADYLPEVLRWWDRWLLGRDNGIDKEPPVSLYTQESSWRAERDWPLERSTRDRFYLTAAGLSKETEGEARWLPYIADPTVGVAAGFWEPLATGRGLPLEQSEDQIAR
jgi:putative CocE/NonD family hydrolase